MKVINFGSLNIDHVYEVESFVRPGETIKCKTYNKYAGGKGLNQSIALAYAGAEVIHFGKIGTDGIFLKEKLISCGVNTEYVKVTENSSGHAIIEVDKTGENRIILHGGANKDITKKEIEEVILHINKDDYILCQNEINMVSDIIILSKGKGAKIIFNPAPMNEDVKNYPLGLVDYFILNEIEGEGLTGEKDPDNILNIMKKLYSNSAVVLTLGEKGAIYSDNNNKISIPAVKTNAVDTTAAGDTFIGYFVNELINGNTIQKCLETACLASSICVSKMGASDSIPKKMNLYNLAT